MNTEMLGQFESAWRRLGVENAQLSAFGGKVLSSYDEKSRFYHSTAHLQDVLAKLNWARGEMKNNTPELLAIPEAERAKFFDVIELALWYHDVVYDAKAKDNEAQSRNLFLTHARQAGLDENIQKEVAHLIDITAHHKEAKTLAEKIMTDCDLAVFGADAKTFKAYDDNIRREYAHVPAAVYGPVRRSVLKGFLDQKEIFKTPAFRKAFEKQAQDNLKNATMPPLQRLVRKFFR
jgi:predicted metal-dependent HD superfamily phosphohydrolase